MQAHSSLGQLAKSVTEDSAVAAPATRAVATTDGIIAPKKAVNLRPRMPAV